MRASSALSSRHRQRRSTRVRSHSHVRPACDAGAARRSCCVARRSSVTGPVDERRFFGISGCRFRAVPPRRGMSPSGMVAAGNNPIAFATRSAYWLPLASAGRLFAAAARYRAGHFATFLLDARNRLGSDRAYPDDSPRDGHRGRPRRMWRGGGHHDRGRLDLANDDRGRLDFANDDRGGPVARGAPDRAGRQHVGTAVREGRRQRLQLHLWATGVRGVLWSAWHRARRPSEFQKSFANATVERVEAPDGHMAGAEFSNGAMVEFIQSRGDAKAIRPHGPLLGGWFIDHVGAGEKYFLP
jgi:hypothetical protein